MDLGKEKIELFLRSCLAKRLFRGATYLIGEKKKIVAVGAVGRSVVDPETIDMEEDTVFDCASLTKPLCTALLSVILAGYKILNLNDPVWRFLPLFKTGEKGKMRIIHLLTHTSGLPHWVPLYLHADSPRSSLQYLSTVDLLFRPGEKVLYGCPAYIIMGEVIKKAVGEDIDGVFRDLVTAPLDLKDTEFNPPSSKKRRTAASENGNRFERKLTGKEATGYDGYRKKIIWGKVHDHNSFSLGGVAGNAGLFSNVREMFMLSKEFLGIGKGILDRTQRRLFFKNFTDGLNEARSLGWQIASSKGSAAGSRLSQNSIGHTGFTGVSLWIDPERERTYILCTNRTHPLRREFNMNAIRRRFHGIAASIE